MGHGKRFGRLIGFGAAVLLFAMTTPVGAVPVTFSDGTFPDADWTTQVVPGIGVPVATATGVQVAVGGNPGDHRRVTLTWTEVPTTGTFASHLKNAAVYDPTVSGAIDHIEISFDSNFQECTVGSCPNTTAYMIALKQGDTTYFAPGTFTTPLSSLWLNETVLNLMDTNFSKGGSGSGLFNPDFSAPGAPITFGYWTQNSSASAGPHGTVSGIDNWTVTVFPVEVTPPTGVPEPASLALLGLGLAGLWLARCRPRSS